MSATSVAAMEGMWCKHLEDFLSREVEVGHFVILGVNVPQTILWPCGWTFLNSSEARQLRKRVKQKVPQIGRRSGSLWNMFLMFFF